MLFLPHRFNGACLVKNPYGNFRCQNLDNVRVSNNNTKHQFIPPLNDYLVPCFKIIQHIDLTEKLHIDAAGNVL